MSLDLCCSSTLYRLSISLAAHFKDKIAFFASVITGVKRCVILLYCVNSTLLGSIIINFKFSVEFLNSKELIIACIVTDFPLPVVPAIKRWGIFAKFENIAFPEMLLPSAIMRGFSELVYSLWDKRDASPTVVFTTFGISL